MIIFVVVGLHLHAGGVAEQQQTPTGAKRYSRQTRHLLGFVRPPAHGYSCNETRIRHPAKLLRVHLQLVGCERRL